MFLLKLSHFKIQCQFTFHINWNRYEFIKLLVAKDVTTVEREFPQETFLEVNFNKILSGIPEGGSSSTSYKQGYPCFVLYFELDFNIHRWEIRVWQNLKRYINIACCCRRNRNMRVVLKLKVLYCLLNVFTIYGLCDINI